MTDVHRANSCEITVDWRPLNGPEFWQVWLSYCHIGLETVPS